jgi:cobyrinic acid a,c-diamide synthase
MSSFYISAAHKSSGKTTLSIGICAAMRQRGLEVQSFKKGPDYIDPIWLSQVTEAPCYNLDFFTSGNDFILQQFQQYSAGKDVVLVEGNMGLFDGLALDGSDSNAGMAKLLKLPVVLVVDCSGTSRGIAPLLNGYRDFDSDIQYAGVILNKIAGARHEQKLVDVIEAYSDFEILGSVPRNHDIHVTERHLGLIPSNEIITESHSIIDLLSEQANQYIDIDKLLEIESSHSRLGVIPELLPPPQKVSGIRIAVAKDEAFGFYYPGDLDRFEQLGVEIVPFNCLHDSALPDGIDGLFIGGGFPETQVEALSANSALLLSIREAIETGLPAYAECGGLMYLCRELQQNDQVYPLCEVIPASVNMHRKPQGRGYVMLQARHEHPWYDADIPVIKAHEFHYSALQDLPTDLDYAYSIKRGTGIDGMNDGIILHNLVANYSHLRRTDLCSWVDDFVAFVVKCKLKKLPGKI